MKNQFKFSGDDSCGRYFLVVVIVRNLLHSGAPLCARKSLARKSAPEAAMTMATSDSCTHS